MKQSKKIAITGGIGSGKSTVGNILKARGYPVFSCDEIYARLWEEAEFGALLRERFPSCVRNGSLDRQALARLVFADERQKNALETLSHPRIMERLLGQMEQFPLSFAEVPLLYEGGYEGLFDGVLAVMRERKRRIAAVMARSGLSEEEVLFRMNAQRDWDVPPPHCIPIRNDGSLLDLETRLGEVLSSF